MSFSRQILIFICIWGLLIYFFLTKLNTNASSSREVEEILFEIEKSIENKKSIDLELRKLLDEYVNDIGSVDQKSDLLKRINSKFDDTSDPVNTGGKKRGTAPSLEYEELRRRVTNNIEEFALHLQAELAKTENLIKGQLDPQQSLKILSNFLGLAKEHKRSLLNDAEMMKRNDGYESFRHNEAKSLTNLVQKRLHYIQNPPDCKKARKLVCKLNKGCGYGCQLHHVVYCFIMAYVRN